MVFSILNIFSSVYADLLNFIHITVGDEPEDADIEAPKIYESIGTFENLSNRLKMFMASYNETIRGGRLDLVFFRVSALVTEQRVMTRSCETRNQYEQS